MDLSLQKLPSSTLMTLLHRPAYVPMPLTTDLPVGTVLGEYVIERKLDEGGMATVYGAVHPLIGKRAAIKVMTAAMSADPDQVQRFIQEARAVNAIGHASIVEVFGFGELPDGRSYYMMEWLRGETLFHRMSTGLLPLDETLHIVDVICDALEAAHEHGIVHRDLKPGNVFLVPTRGQLPTPKLLDFGVAKLMNVELGAGNRGPTTLSGHVVGTPSYISPEQARGMDVDGRTDLYALGVMLYEMVLGSLPFVATTPAELLCQHLVQPPPSPRLLWPDIPPALEALILGLLDKDQTKRPGTMEVRAVISALRAPERVQSPTEPAALRYDPAWAKRSIRARGRGSRMLVWGSLCACLAGAGIVGTAAARHPRATPSTTTPPRNARPVPPTKLPLAPRVARLELMADVAAAPVPHLTVSVARPQPARVSRQPEPVAAQAPRVDPDYLVDPFKDSTP